MGGGEVGGSTEAEGRAEGDANEVAQEELLTICVEISEHVGRFGDLKRMLLDVLSSLLKGAASALVLRPVLDLRE